MIIKKKLLSITTYEYLVPAFASASIIISCVIISSKKYFWNDEVYSYYLLADPSFMHMLVAFHDKINNTPFLYFLTGWFWAKAFGSTELSLRLFSSLGICVAFVAVWVTLRRTYNFLSVCLGTLTIFCGSELILSQNAEARMYGLFLTVCSLGLLQYSTLNRDLSGARLSHKLRNLFFNTCIHIAIVNTHLFGIFYSGAILFSQFLGDCYFKNFKTKIYLSIVLSWFSLAFYIPSFINQAAAGYPRTWIPTPTFIDLLSLLNPSLPSFWGFNILILIILIIGLKVIASFNQYSYLYQFTFKNHKSEIYLLVFAYVFLVIPVLVWFISRTIKPIFIDRYMIPTTLSWPILFAFFFSRVIPSVSQTSFSNSKESQLFSLSTLRENILLLSLIFLLLIYPLKNAAHFPKEQMPGLNDGKYGYHDLPIVTQFSHDFVKRFIYAPERNRYFLF